MALKRTGPDTVLDLAVYVILGALTLAALFPVVYVAVMSFCDTNSFIPQNLSLDAYRYVFSTRTFMRSIGVSILVTSAGTAVSMIMTILLAYSLSCKQLRGRGVFLFLITFTMIFNGGIIPTFMIVRRTGLYNSLWALMIPNAISAYNLILMKNYFMSLPEELRESARIDGCHELRLIFQIILPVSLPILATIGLFYAVSKWNIFMEALLYLRDSGLWPVQVLLRNIIFVITGGLGDSGEQMVRLSFSEETMKCAVIVVSTLPIMAVYPFLQKYFTKGLLMGSVKG
ncbi:MAG: carbohydrate ABC transporter permease [Treponema sp.]|jgi:putative aldouronate transport system permease protein|nr:carbohydrate ABC transporter permease [Treponema sp.]